MYIFLYKEYLFSFLLTFLVMCIFAFFAGKYLVKPSPKYYRTSYFDLPIPERWECESYPNGIIECKGDEVKHRSIMIIAAKWRNDDDNLRSYRSEMLNKVSIVDGLKITPIEHGFVSFGDRKWYFTKLLESEVKSYYTYYYATVSELLGILVTYSVHMDSDRELKSEFEEIISDIFVNARSSF